MRAFVGFMGAVCALAVCAATAQAGVVYGTVGGVYGQDFDSLASSGSPSWTNDSTLPGWSLFRQPAPGTPVTSYTAGTGSSNAGAFYSFGLNNDRALGGVGSGGTYFGSASTGSVAGWWAVSIDNATGSSLSAFTVGFDGEQWRNGGNAATQTMVLEYGFGASFTSVANWTAPGGAFDFVSPVATASAGALDGNAAANRIAGLGGTISNLNWANGSTLWIRWVERNDSGNDHGLSIDNFSFRAVPEPASLVMLGLGIVAFARRRG